MLKIINPVNTYRQPLSRKMKKKSKIGLFVMVQDSKIQDSKFNLHSIQNIQDYDRNI